MSDKYDEYLKEHVANVRKGILWFYEHMNDIPISRTLLVKLADQHDFSKLSAEEYDAYDEYFYGKEGKDKEELQNIDEAFDYAWLSHIHHNKHHWQHWVLQEDEGKTKALEIPEEYVYEMIADWWSFSWRSGNLNEIFDWYEKHKDRMILHSNTRKLVEDILEKMKTALEEDDPLNASNTV